MIQIKKAADRTFYFVVIGGNGRVIATSKYYISKGSCKTGAQGFLYTVASPNLQIIDLTKA